MPWVVDITCRGVEFKFKAITRSFGLYCTPGTAMKADGGDYPINADPIEKTGAW